MTRICSSLALAGYEVTLIGFLRKNSIPLADKPYDQKRVNLFFTKGKLFYLEYNIKLLFHFLTNFYDIHCAIDLDTILASFITTKLKSKRKLVLDAHELYLGLPEVSRRPQVKSIWSRLERWIYPKLKHAYTVNESLAEHYRTAYKLDMKVIRNFPMKTAITSSERNEDKGIIIYQGWLNEGRGLEQLIEAMTQVDAELWLIGEGELSKSLRELPKEFGIENKVVFTGYLEPDELKDKTAAATIGVNLLDGSSQNYYLSLANKFFDYVQAGIPQISMAFPEYLSLNSESEVALLVNDLDVAGITEALNTLLENETLYSKLKNNCFEAREEWIWQEEEKKLLEFYKDLDAS